MSSENLPPERSGHDNCDCVLIFEDEHGRWRVSDNLGNTCVYDNQDSAEIVADAMVKVRSKERTAYHRAMNHITEEWGEKGDI